MSGGGFRPAVIQRNIARHQLRKHDTLVGQWQVSKAVSEWESREAHSFFIISDKHMQKSPT